MSGFVARKMGNAGDPVRQAIREELKRRRREADGLIREIDGVLRLGGDEMVDAAKVLLDRLNGHAER